MTGRVRVRVSGDSEVGEARRAATRVAVDAGLTEAKVGSVALVATELARNLALHARQGEILLQSHRVDDGPVVDVISLDAGPGIADLDRCLTDGFSTAGTMGAGLGGVRRMADTFDAFSLPEWGTVLFARVGGKGNTPTTRRFEWGCVCLPVQGERECGDSWSVRVQDGTFSAMVADGLGHGPLAAQAVQAAETVFQESLDVELVEFLARAHGAMTSTRGAAVGVARSALDPRVSFAGVGNVSGAIVAAQEQRSLASQNGTIGLALPRVRTFEYGWPDRSLLVMHSDGLRSRWDLSSYPGLHARHPSIVAAALYKDHRRTSDDVTVLVARRIAA